MSPCLTLACLQRFRGRKELPNKGAPRSEGCLARQGVWRCAVLSRGAGLLSEGVQVCFSLLLLLLLPETKPTDLSCTQSFLAGLAQHRHSPRSKPVQNLGCRLLRRCVTGSQPTHARAMYTQCMWNPSTNAVHRGMKRSLRNLCPAPHHMLLSPHTHICVPLKTTHNMQSGRGSRCLLDNTAATAAIDLQGGAQHPATRSSLGLASAAGTRVCHRHAAAYGAHPEQMCPVDNIRILSTAACTGQAAFAAAACSTAVKFSQDWPLRQQDRVPLTRARHRRAATPHSPCAGAAQIIQPFVCAVCSTGKATCLACLNRQFGSCHWQARLQDTGGHGKGRPQHKLPAKAWHAVGPRVLTCETTHMQTQRRCASTTFACKGRLPSSGLLCIAHTV